jgi:hypothetical protein
MLRNALPSNNDGRGRTGLGMCDDGGGTSAVPGCDGCNRCNGGEARTYRTYRT